MAKLTKAQRTQLAHIIEHIAVLEVEYSQASSAAAKSMVMEDKARAAAVLAEQFGVQLPMVMSLKRRLSPW